MNINELKEHLSQILAMDGLGLNIHFLLDTDSEKSLKRADIIEDVKDDLIESYKRSLQDIIENEDLAVINLSEADDRRSAIYRYDLEDKPSLFDHFNEVSASENLTSPDYFSFNDDNLADLEGYFVHLGDAETNVIIYRKQMPVNLFKRGKIYLIRNDETQFQAIDDEFLRIDAKIDVIKIDDIEFIYNISILERHYEFKEIIESEAENSLENIEGLEILENIEVLQERVVDIAFARKLSKISTTSPVFTLPPTQIIAFVRSHRVLGNEFRYNEDQSKILLDTKKSQNFFLKLMNDDFLHSELTDYDYMTPAKDRLQSE